MDRDAARQAFVEACASRDSEWAALALQPETEVHLYPTPFLSRHQIARIVHKTPHGPTGSVVAFGDGGPVTVLSGDPRAFIAIARADGVRISDEAAAVRYAMAMLETTAATDELFRPVDSVDDIVVWPAPSDKDLERITAVRERYRDTVKTATAVTAGTAFVVVLHALRQRKLERHVVTVTPDGSATDLTEVLQERLPVVFGA